MQLPTNDDHHPVAERFRDFIQHVPFPCVGAKSALSRNQMKIVVARDITSGWDDLRIYPALLAFVSWYTRAPSPDRRVAGQGELAATRTGARGRSVRFGQAAHPRS